MTVTSSDSVDTNILIYAIDASQGTRHTRARRLVDVLSTRKALLPLQALNEFFFVCVKRKAIPLSVAQAYVEFLLRSMTIVSPDPLDLHEAMRLHQEHKQQFFDALLISTAARAGCHLFFSEDMQNGRTFGSLQIVNPFALTDQDFDALLA